MSGTPDAAIAARLRDAGLHRVDLPPGNGMDGVNAWIVADDPLTLVDAGTRGPGALAALEEALRGLGRRVEDVGLVLLTHHHTDHIGLVAEVVRRSGAEVAALAPVAPYLEGFAVEGALDRTYMADLLRRHGADDAAIEGNDRDWTRFHRLAEPCRVSVPLVAGARVELRDRTLEVLHRPGHSETDVLLVDAERRMALGGDHVLSMAPSVPVRDRPLGEPGAGLPGADDDLSVLVRYRDSLRATRDLPVDVVLPGHGPAFGDLAGVVDGHLRRQEDAALGLVRKAPAGPFSAHALARSVWAEAPRHSDVVMLWTVLGAFGLLRERGLLVPVPGNDGITRFAVAEGPAAG